MSQYRNGGRTDRSNERENETVEAIPIEGTERVMLSGDDSPEAWIELEASALTEVEA